MDEGLFERAVTGFGRRLELIADDQWSGPTPCADWDVRTLVNHVAGELLWAPPLLAGQTVAEVGDRLDGDLLGTDFRAAWATATAGALGAAAEPGAQARTVHLSFGDFSGSDYLAQITSDVVIHSWDLARAIGADEGLDPELVEFVDGFLGPQIEAWRSAGAFGPAVEVPDNADLQARLLARTGRS